MRLINYINYNKNTSNYLVFIAQLLYETGVRPSEIFQMSKSNFSYIDGVFNFTQGKTKTRRSVKISDSLLKEARYYRKSRGNIQKNFKNVQNLRRNITNNIHLLYAYVCGNKKLYYFRYLYVLRLIKEGKTDFEMSQKLAHNDKCSIEFYKKTALNIEKERTKRRRQNG